MSIPSTPAFQTTHLPNAFEQIVNDSPDMVVVTDAQHRVTWINAAFGRNTGWAARQCEGKPFRNLLVASEDQQRNWDALMDRLRQDGRLKSLELQVGTGQGGTQSLCLDVDAVREAEGDVVAFVLRFRLPAPGLGRSPGPKGTALPVLDFADTVPYEHAPVFRSTVPARGSGAATRLRGFTRPLKALSEATQKMNECLVAGSLSAFSAELDRACGSVATLKGKVDALLGASQAVIGELPQRRIDTGELVHELVDTLMSKTGERTIAWTIDPELPQIEADPALVREVWNKLLANALTRSAYQDVSLIEVGWKPQLRGWEFFVHDNGCSFDAEQAGQLFEVLAKPAGRERSAIAGAGRSLALVRRIVEIHGGRVWSHSELGQGASFHFFLPSHMSTLAPAHADTVPVPSHSA